MNSVDWSAVTHAYGPADDVPGMLRAAASADPGTADKAWSDIFGTLFHQGTVYPATVAAMPFLVALVATAPNCRVMALSAVGMAADPHHSYGRSFPEVQAAVRAHAGAVAALLDDPDAELRQVAAYAAAHAGVDPARLWGRWRVETVPEVRASLLLALALRDPAGAAAPVREALEPSAAGPAEVTAAAALATARAGNDVAGYGWPGSLTALAAVIEAGAEVDYVWQHGESVVLELLSTVDDEFADRLLDLLPPSPPVLYAMEERCRLRWSAPRRLAARLGPLLDHDDAEIAAAALSALVAAGPAAAPWADALAGIAARYPRTPGVAIDPPRRAVELLMRLGDARWVGPVCAAWAARAAGLPGSVVRARTLRYSDAVLAAVRARLSATPSPAPPVVAGLALVLRLLGPDARAAAAELRAVRALAPADAVRALVAMDAADVADLPGLLELAGDGDVGAALACLRLTGDVAPVETAAGKALSAGSVTQLHRAADAGVALPGLLPRLRRRLTGVGAATYPERELQVAAGQLVWLVTRDTAEVVPTVRAVLRGGNLPARQAALFAGQLHVADLEPDLRDLLTDRLARVAAARALSALGVAAGDLVPALVAAIGAGYQGSEALRLLVGLRARAAVADLIRLAGQEGRVQPGSTADETAWADERFRAELHAAIAALQDTAGAGR